MIKYLIIQLDTQSVSYCHYPTAAGEPRLISLDDLSAGIMWAMKENATVQFVYPQRQLPDEYHAAIESIDHAKIVPSTADDKELLAAADVVVLDGWSGAIGLGLDKEKAYVVRTTLAELQANADTVGQLLAGVARLNVVLTDIETFKEAEFEQYKSLLATLAEKVKEQYRDGNVVQFNLLTDRLMLTAMNNCNAGWETVALCPDGRFYACPAFHADGGEPLGDLKSGLDIKNPQLYRLDHAPICRCCDAWQCRRCAWLNRRLTLEVNTPSHEQCVVAHLERNASRQLLQELQAKGMQLTNDKIEKINYLDPFDIVKEK